MSRLRFPHPFALLVGCVLVAAILTHVLPAGQYQRRDDPATGRKVVVAGSYAAVAAKPVGPFETLVAIPKGMADAGSVIFLLFLVGGALTVVDQTGALREGVAWLARRLGRRESLIVPASCVVFATGGALDGMFEEVIAFIPLLLVLTRRMGFDGLTAVAMSLGAAGVGGTFSPINPFNVGISQKLAELPLLSGSLFRLLVLAAALAIWTWGTMRYAARTRTADRTDEATEPAGLSVRHATVLLAVVGAFGAFVFGVVRYGWGFDQMSALFFLMGIAAGLQISGHAPRFLKELGFF